MLVDSHPFRPSVPMRFTLNRPHPFLNSKHLRDVLPGFPCLTKATCTLAAILTTAQGVTEVASPKIEGTANPDPIAAQDPIKALLSTVTYPTEMKAAIFAMQPDVQTPTAISFDEQNRLYIAETHRFGRGIEDNRRNPHWVRDDIALKSPAERLEMYRKYSNVKPMDYYTKHSEIIRVLEYKDGDGACDHSQVFADGFNDPLDGTAAGILAMNGNVYFACIPNVWLLKDTDGDGKADQRKSLQTGYGISVSLSGHDLNGFTPGPDGRIYFTIGDRAYNLDTPDGRHLYDQYAGAIFRMEPDGSKLEVVHRGLRNPKELAFDQYGAAFSVDNNADMGDKARVVYMVEGADSGWNRGHQNFNNFTTSIDIGRQHSTPWLKESMWNLTGTNRPAAYLPPADFISTGPSGLAYNPGIGLDPKWDNHLFVCDFRGGDSEVIAFEMQPQGAGYKLASKESFVKGFLNTDIEFGYDGKVYVSDYTGSWTSFGLGAIYSFYNPVEIEKPAVKETRQLFAQGFDQRSPEELSRLLAHSDMRVRQRAQFALAKDPKNLSWLQQATAKSNRLVTRLHGLWGIGQIARLTGNSNAISSLATLTQDAEARVRGQAAQAIGDASPASQRAALALLLNDPDANTAMLAAIALGKAGDPADIPALIKLLEKNADQDAYLRHGAIQGLKTIVEKSGKADELGKFAKHPSTAVRRGLVITLRQLKHRAIAVFLKDPDASIAIEAIQAINDAYIEDARAELANATEWLGKSTPQIDQRIINAIYRVGGDANLKKILQLLADEKQPESVRVECLFVLRRWDKPPVADPTTGQVHPIEGNRSIAALRAELSRTLQHLLETTTPNLLADVILATETLDVPVDPKAMLMHFENPKKPTAIRLAALKNLLHAKAPQLNTALGKTVDDGDREIRVQSFAALSQLDPESALQQATKILGSTQSYDRQQMFATLAIMDNPKAGVMIFNALRDLKQQSPDVQLDILDAAGKRNEPDIVKALAAYRASLDPNDPLASYSVTVEGGDAAKGRRVFYNHGSAECSRCHMAEKQRVGGNAGPNLGNVGSLHPREYLMESMIHPGAKIAPGYGVVSVTLKDGKTIAGKLMKEDDTQMEIADLATGKSQSYPRADIQSSTLPLTTMPPMGGMLTQQEVRDVVAYLASLRDGKK